MHFYKFWILVTYKTYSLQIFSSICHILISILFTTLTVYKVFILMWPFKFWFCFSLTTDNTVFIFYTKTLASIIPILCFILIIDFEIIQM